LKAYEGELLAVIAEVGFGLGEYERQKKSMLAQIELLRIDNDHLSRTVNELHTIIEALEREVSEYFERNALAKYIGDERGLPVPFARTFSHSLEEMAMVKLMEDEPDRLIPAAQFCAFLLDLKRDSEDMLHGIKFESCLLSNSLCQSFGQESSVWHWLTEIVSNLSSLAVSPSKSRFPARAQAEQRTKVIEAFLGRLSRSRDHFLASIACHTQLSRNHLILPCTSGRSCTPPS
jgi:hypothetical protein